MSKLTEAPQHARLSPSAAHRWLECPGSVPLAGSAPDVPTIFAAEGTLQHDLAAGAIRRRLKGEPDGLDRLIGYKAKVDGFDFTVNDDHIENVRWCVDRVFELIGQLDQPEVYVEVRVDLHSIEPGMFGTSDVVIVDTKGRTIYVLDHKFGSGVKVYAADNPQFICYALGTVDQYSLFSEFDRAVFGVLQPRLDHHDTSELTIGQLEGWRDRLKSAAHDTRQPSPRLSAGDWCRFCPVKANCPALHEKALTIAKAVFDDGQLVDKETRIELDQWPDVRLAEILRQAPMIRSYLEAVEKEAFRRLDAGLPVEGYKLVIGKSPPRKYVDEASVYRWMQDTKKLDNTDIETPRELISPAQLEKVCKNHGIKFPEHLVTKMAGGKTLAPIEDKRPAVGPAFEALDSDSPGEDLGL